MKSKRLVLQRPPMVQKDQSNGRSTTLLSRISPTNRHLRLVDNEVLLNLIKIVALYLFAFCDPSSMQYDQFDHFDVETSTNDLTKVIALHMTALKKNLVLFLEQHLVGESPTASPSSSKTQQGKRSKQEDDDPVSSAPSSFWMNLTFSSSTSSSLMKSIEAGFMVEQNSFKMIQLFFRKQKMVAHKKQAVLMALLSETLSQLDQPIVLCPSSSALKSTLEYFLSNEPTTINAALLYPIVNAIDCLQMEQRECLDALTLLWNSVSQADPQFDEAFAQHYHRYLFGMETSNQEDFDKEELLSLCFARTLLKHSDHLFRRGDQQIPGLADILDSTAKLLDDDEEFLSDGEEAASETSTARDEDDEDEEHEQEQLQQKETNKAYSKKPDEQPHEDNQEPQSSQQQQQQQQYPSFQHRTVVRKTFYRDQLKSLKKKKKREEKLKEQRKNAEKQRLFDEQEMEKQALNAGVYVGIAAGTIAAFVRFVVKITS